MPDARAFCGMAWRHSSHGIIGLPIPPPALPNGQGGPTRRVNRMAEQDKNLTEIQASADRLIGAHPEEQAGALEELAQAILEHHGHSRRSTAIDELFSRELPWDIQRFAAVWLVRVLTESSMALHTGDSERLAASLFDHVFQKDVYRSANVDTRAQTFEKLKALTDHAQQVLCEADDVVRVSLDLNQLQPLQQDLMRLLNRKAIRPLLVPLLPRPLINKNRITSLFQAVRDYTTSTDPDPIHMRNAAFDACDEFEDEARTFGTTDSDRILGELARRLKAAVTSHFDSLEAGKHPRLTFSPIAKKYPLGKPNINIAFKVKIANVGTGPARDIRLDEVVSDDSLNVRTLALELGTIRVGESFNFDIDATVTIPSGEAKLLATLSWSEPRGRTEETYEFIVPAQRDDVDWEKVEFTEPYSLEAVTAGSDLIGRKEELTRLLRLANSQTVGSGFIYGQKRVGKTSLANAVAERLESSDKNWIVIKKGSGDYVGGENTLRALGNVLVQAMRDRIPGLASLPFPDFADGLAPLSGFVDQALKVHGDLRLLFILDEFDELPAELFRRTDLSTSLFLPLREISNKRGCGFLLVGGESMQQIINLQGDRLNKFRQVELDYFSKSNDWSDFVELIRRPVQDWLTISDAALEDLFVSSAGNPYFAKLLAAQLFSDMVKNRYSDASEADMRAAIQNALTSSVGANSFAHFWTDGLEDSQNAEEIRIIRRSILIAAGRVFRRKAVTEPEDIWREFRSSAGFPFEEQRFRVTLQDFVRRKVLVEDQYGRVTPKIPLFQAWLEDKGVGELLGGLSELDYLRSKLQDEESVRVGDDEIASLSGNLLHFRFRGRPIEPAAIKRWLEQFENAEDQRLMFRLLMEVKPYDEGLVRRKMKEAFGIVTRNMRTVIEAGSRVRNDIFVSSLDNSAAKGGLTYCRLFASENRISTQLVQPLRTLERRFDPGQEAQRLVLIDDFSGTGRTLAAGLKRELNLLRRVNAVGIHIIVIALVGFADARNHVERFIKQNGLQADLYFCDELGSEHTIFSERSEAFPDPDERDRAKQAAEAMGVKLEPKQPLGYGDTQSVVVFYDSCPNNTLPILWSQKNGWSPLFPRI